MKTRKYIITKVMLITTTILVFAMQVGAVNIAPINSDISYSTAHERCVLDVKYAGKDRSSQRPVLVWFHGGGLVGGDKHFIPLEDTNIVQVAVRYPFLTKDGSVTVTNILDVAANAVNWTFDHIREFGGDPKKVFVAGHSAGGYITMMLGMDKRWLGKYGRKPSDLKGIIPLSGQATTHFNVRAHAGDKDSKYLPKIDELAPLAYVAEQDLPNFLDICGDPNANEWKGRAEENELLIASLKACGHKKAAEYVRLPNTNHGTMLYPAYSYINQFIHRMLKEANE